MKMPIDLYKELEADVKTVIQNYYIPRGFTSPLERGDMWSIFNTIMVDRMNDDTHPIFAEKVRPRILPFWSRNGETKAMQGNDHWLNRFYGNGLDDSHITTALNRIHRSLYN